MFTLSACSTTTKLGLGFIASPTQRPFCSKTIWNSAGYNPHNSHKNSLQTEIKTISIWGNHLKIFESALQPFVGRSLKDMGTSNFSILDLRNTEDSLDFCFEHHSQENPGIKAIYLTPTQKNCFGIKQNEFPIFLVGGKHDKSKTEVKDNAVCIDLAPSVKGIFKLELKLLSKVILAFAKQQPTLRSINFYKVYPEVWMSWSEGGGNRSEPVLDHPWSINKFAEMNDKCIENLTHENFKLFKIEKIAEPLMKPLYHYDKSFKIDSKIE